MKFKFVKPVGFYPPLIWLEKSKIRNKNLLRLLIFTNLLLRFITYPFCYLFSAVLTVGAVLAATFFNIGMLFGGFLSESWRHRTKEFNRIAITRCQWLIFDPFGFLWNQAKLVAGLFQPKIGVATINRLALISEKLTKTSMFHFDWQKPHVMKLKAMVKFFEDRHLYSVAAILNTLSVELIDAVVIAFDYLKGIKGELHEYGLNPEKLTDDQAQHIPTLFIHGDSHNQSAWLPLAKYLDHHKYPGPLFTINLPSGNTTYENLAIIKIKIEAIKKLYREKDIDLTKFKINLTGHSSGASLAYNLGFPNWNSVAKIGKTILIGKLVTPQKGREDNPPVFINGRNDCLIFSRKGSAKSAKHLVDANHIGILSHSTMFKRCMKEMSAASSWPKPSKIKSS